MKTKFMFRIGAVAVFAATLLFACTKENSKTTPVNAAQNGISSAVLKSISDLGFSTNQLRKVSNGYLVEGDIVLTDENLANASTSPNLRIAETEQYRTTNLVKRLPRTVTVSISNLPAVYATAAQNAIARYNALNLTLRFQFVNSGGDIQIIGFNEARGSDGFILLGSAGFPSRKGDPYEQISLNTNSEAFGTNPDLGYITAVTQHEMGHCIGFRHTDYANRAFSCGGPASNEGASDIGAVLIPGTPSSADAGSWMLACNNGGDKTFNGNDKIALDYLY